MGLMRNTAPKNAKEIEALETREWLESLDYVLQSGGPTNVWKEESIDPSAEFRAHFEGDVPDFVGIGIMSDGDQTRSISAADYAGFTLLH